MSLTKPFNVSMTTTELPGNGTDHSHDPRHISKSIGFLLIPFSIIAFFCLLSGVVSIKIEYQCFYLMKNLPALLLNEKTAFRSAAPSFGAVVHL